MDTNDPPDGDSSDEALRQIAEGGRQAAEASRRAAEESNKTQEVVQRAILAFLEDLSRRPPGQAP